MYCPVSYLYIVVSRRSTARTHLILFRLRLFKIHMDAEAQNLAELPNYILLVYSRSHLKNRGEAILHPPGILQFLCLYDRACSPSPSRTPGFAIKIRAPSFSPHRGFICEFPLRPPRVPRAPLPLHPLSPLPVQLQNYKYFFSFTLPQELVFCSPVRYPVKRTHFCRTPPFAAPHPSFPTHIVPYFLDVLEGVGSGDNLSGPITSKGQGILKNKRLSTQNFPMCDREIFSFSCEIHRNLNYS